MTKAALITGITRQDGSYLAEFLLNKGYEVYGLVRRLSTSNMSRISHIVDNIMMQAAQHVEVYNLEAQSFVATSLEPAP